MKHHVSRIAFFALTQIVTLNAFANEHKASNEIDLCPLRMNETQKSQIFSRTLATGASFTHGCTSCDQNDPYRSFLNLSNDSYWMRRNPILYFLHNEVFQQPNTTYAVFENDPAHPLIYHMPEAQLKKQGYNGLWTYTPQRETFPEHVSLMSSSRFKEISERSAFKKNLPLFGELYTRFKFEPNRSTLRGTLYTAVNNDTFAEPYSVFDMSLDGGRMQDLFIHFGDAKLYKKLEKANWTLEAERELLIQKTVQRFTSLNPTVVIGIDALFWDSIAHTFSLMQKNRPSSPYLAFVLNFIKRAGLMNDVFNDERYERIFATYLETMRRISVQNQNTTPVAIARVMTDGIETIKSNASAVASIVSLFLNHYSERNFFAELYKWIKKVAYKQNVDGTLTPRTETYYDDVTERYYSLGEIVKIQDQLKRVMVTEKNGFFTSDPLSGGPLKDIPPLQSGLLNIIILQALGDLPLFIESLAQSFDDTNQKVETFLSQNQKPSAVRLINADSFFKQFPAFLKPETMHPDVYGAKRISKVITTALCE